MGYPVFETKFQNGIADPPTPGPKLDCSSSCVFRQYLCFFDEAVLQKRVLCGGVGATCRSDLFAGFRSILDPTPFIRSFDGRNPALLFEQTGNTQSRNPQNAKQRSQQLTASRRGGI